MALEQFVQQLSLDLELDPPPSLDENQTMQLALNPTLTISLKELDPEILLFSQIIPCPKEKKEGLFTFLMRANFLGQGTGGNVIGLDSEEKFLTLSSTLSHDLNYKTFKETLEDFGNYVDYWREEISRYQDNTGFGLFS